MDINTEILIEDLKYDLKKLNSKYESLDFVFKKMWEETALLLDDKNLHPEYREGVVDCRIIMRLLQEEILKNIKQ